MNKLVFTFIFIMFCIIIVNYFKFKKNYGKFNFLFGLNTKKYDIVCSHACNNWGEYIELKDVLNITLYESSDSDTVMATSKNTGINKGVININSSVFEKYNFDKKVQTILHEIGHILGVGTHDLWTKNIKNNKLLLENLPNCKREYNSIQGKLLGKESNFDYIPLTNCDKGKNSENKHWEANNIYDENNKILQYGLYNDIMCHTIKGKGYISNITTGFLEDLGYEIKKYDEYLI